MPRSISDPASNGKSHRNGLDAFSLPCSCSCSWRRGAFLLSPKSTKDTKAAVSEPKFPQSGGARDFWTADQKSESKSRAGRGVRARIPQILNIPPLRAVFCLPHAPQRPACQSPPPRVLSAPQSWVRAQVRMKKPYGSRPRRDGGLRPEHRRGSTPERFVTTA